MAQKDRMDLKQYNGINNGIGSGSIIHIMHATHIGRNIVPANKNTGPPHNLTNSPPSFCNI